MGVDVYACALGLFQEQLKIVKVMATDHDKGTSLDGLCNGRWHGRPIRPGVRAVE
jgi:hypothetical protein